MHDIVGGRVHGEHIRNVGATWAERYLNAITIDKGCKVVPAPKDVAVY